MIAVKGFYVFHKLDTNGFYYADMHTNLRMINQKVTDSFGNKLLITKIDEFWSKELALAAMMNYRKQYKQFNLLKDARFVDRGDRVANNRFKRNQC